MVVQVVLITKHPVVRECLAARGEEGRTLFRVQNRLERSLAKSGNAMGGSRGDKDYGCRTYD
jgi:hypothetical protein